MKKKNLLEWPHTAKAYSQPSIEPSQWENTGSKSTVKIFAATYSKSYRNMTWNMHLPNEIRPTCDICSKLSQMVKLYLFTRCRIDIFIVNVEQISLIILTQEVNTCSKSILITLFSWLWIDFFPTECIHCVKCPNTELFLARIFLYSDWILRFTL